MLLDCPRETIPLELKLLINARVLTLLNSEEQLEEVTDQHMLYYLVTLEGRSETDSSLMTTRILGILTSFSYD